MAVIAPDMRVFAREYMTTLKEVIDSVAVEDVQAVIEVIEDAYRQDRQIFIAGNGGSAATASHMACDLAKTTLGKQHHSAVQRFRVIALTDNVPLMTAWGNDANYDVIFAEQLRAFARPGDVLVVITGSGNSPNIVEAIKAARELGVETVGLLGFDGGIVRELLDTSLVVRSTNYGHIEDLHMVLTHLLTAYFKDRLEPARPAMAWGNGRPLASAMDDRIVESSSSEGIK